MTLRRFGLSVLLLLFVFVAPGHGEGEDNAALIDPGSEGPLRVPGSDAPCHLYVPTDYVKGARLPLIFFLHGSGGKPTSWPWKSATEGKGYFIVGMSYGAQPDAGAGGIKSDASTITAMIAFLEKTRALMHERYGIDQRRVFLSGLSMGGWGVNFYGFQDVARGRYRGYCIMAAGIMESPKPDLTVLEGMPLLLLNGEKDANLAAANRGKPQFEQAGAILKQVVISGEGHVPSIATMAPPLKAWLDEIEQADAHQRALAAIKWKDAPFEGVPGTAGATKEENLLAWVKAQSFMEKVVPGRPLLVFFTTAHEDKKGRPSKQAQESLRVDEQSFGYPAALATPASARACVCFRASIDGLRKKTSPLLHRDLAPVVLLVDREHKALRILAKGKLKDAALAKELRSLLSSDEAAAADARVASTKPVLQEMRKLQRSIDADQKALRKLRTSPRKKGSAKKQKRLTTSLDALRKKFEELHEKLAD